MKRAKRVPPPRLLVSIEDAGTMLSIGRTKVTELIAAKTLPAVRIGRSVRIPLAALEKWVANLFAAGYTPVMKTLETVEGTRQEARNREIYWLHHYREQGPLFNQSEFP